VILSDSFHPPPPREKLKAHTRESGGRGREGGGGGQARRADTLMTGNAAGLPAPEHPDLNRRRACGRAFPDMGDHTYRASYDNPADCAGGGGLIRVSLRRLSEVRT
jgi:hypothetical protein